jgi:hypothetical protein
LTQNNVKDYAYFMKYKNNLTQFIIHNCTYSKNKKRHNRINFNERELLGLLKELADISLYIKHLDK